MHRPYLNAVGRRAAEGGDRVRQISRAPARQCRARRCAAPGILSRGRRDARARPRQALAACCGAGRRSAGRSARSSRRCLPRIGACSKRTCCASNSIASGPTRPGPASLNFLLGWIRGAAMAAPAGDGAPGRLPLPSYRGHRRLLRSSRPLRRRRVDQHDDQSRAPTRARHAG